jgi:membrane protease YdiL (CAAX protease family)
MKKLFKDPVAPTEYSLDQKIVLGISLWLLLSINFTLNYLIHTYYSDYLLEVQNPGYWLFVLNNVFLVGILLFVKRSMRWSWGDLGLSKPVTWWKPVLITVLTFASLVVFSQQVQPALIESFGPHQNISYLYTVQGNLPRLISVLVTAWITSAILEEIIFRSFVINTLEDLLGRTPLATWTAVIISAMIFGGIHAYQGLTGILTTASIGLIFGIAYIFNGRRIWPLILVHGLVDSIMLINIYNS